MATIIQASELVRRAVVYVDEQRIARPHISLAIILDEAGMQFNLNPLDCACLERLFQERSECEQNKE